jgi:cytochrome c-type biogenesis protein CcmH/NrfF
MIRTAVLVALLTTTPALAAQTTQQAVEESLTCQCGCGLTVHSCNHIQCSSGEPIKEEIHRRLTAGEDKETILAYFAGKYGEKVLSSPTMSGFNSLAWVTPFAAVAIAGLTLVVVVRRRVHAQDAAPAPGPAAAGDAALRSRLERELADLDRDA